MTSSNSRTGAVLSGRAACFLKLSVVVMTILIAAGLILLVYGLKQQMGKLADKTPDAEAISLTLPQGAVLRSIVAADEAGSVWLHLDRADGQAVLMLINKTGQLVRTIHLEQAQ